MLAFEKYPGEKITSGEIWNDRRQGRLWLCKMAKDQGPEKRWENKPWGFREKSSLGRHMSKSEGAKERKGDK